MQTQEMPLSEAARRAMAGRGLRETARAWGIDPSILHRILRGKNPGLTTCRTLAKRCPELRAPLAVVVFDNWLTPEPDEAIKV